MSIFNLKKPKKRRITIKKYHEKLSRCKKDICCCECGIKLGEYLETKEVNEGTDDIYDVCPNCYDIVVNKMVEKAKKEGIYDNSTS